MLIGLQHPKFIATILILAALIAVPALAQTGSAQEQRKALLERAKAAELPGTWTPAPVTKLSHAAATYAQRVCSAVFIAGMSPAFAKVTQGDNNPLAPLVERVQLGEPIVDSERQEVRVALPVGGARIARRYGSQGCVILPEGSDAIALQPSAVVTRLGRFPGRRPATVALNKALGLLLQAVPKRP